MEDSTMLRTPSLLLALCAMACAAAGTGADANRIETIAREDGIYSEELREMSAVIANSDEEFARIWVRVYAGRMPMPPVPAIDFTRESVVIATSGRHGSGGYSVSIDSLTEIPEGMRLAITAHSPGSRCIVTEGLTTPVHIVRVRKLPGVVLFDWRDRVEECP
jgi:hypothetical protein